MFLEQKFTLAEVLTACKAGERRAQEMLYKQFASIFLGICLRYVSDRTEAEDILQTGFIKIFQNLHSFRNEGSFEGWMKKIMVNSAIEHYRKFHTNLQMVELSYAENERIPSNFEEGNLQVNDLLALVQQLAPGYRIIFNLFAVDGYSHKEIATLTGISEGASKSQLSRARSILRDQVLKMEKENYGNAG